MDEAKLKRLEELYAARTPSAWSGQASSTDDGATAPNAAVAHARADLDLAAAAVDALPELIAAARRTRRRKADPTWDDQVVDGSGLTLRESAKEVARMASLTRPQASLLLATLRNALVPSFHEHPTRGLRYVLSICDELHRLDMERDS